MHVVKVIHLDLVLSDEFRDPQRYLAVGPEAYSSLCPFSD
jgi:hypothetical protein